MMNSDILLLFRSTGVSFVGCDGPEETMQATNEQPPESLAKHFRRRERIDQRALRDVAHGYKLVGPVRHA